jgi:quercetin dioxygenase-like cupin family protein
METTDYFRERYRTHAQIKEGGALGNLAEGIEIAANGIATRLIAWPGNGFQTMGVHVLTLPKGTTGDTYAYDMADEAMVCFKGSGEVYLRGQWVSVQPGDVVYYPQATRRAVRNTDGAADFVLVTCISPPQLDLYEPGGFYDSDNKVMNFAAAEYAKINVKRVQYGTNNELGYHDTHSELRAWNLENDDIRRNGALFNVFSGGTLEGLVQGSAAAADSAPMLLILFAGFGTGATGFNFACMTPGMTADIHAHPVADECVINWWGSNPVWVGDGWHQSYSYDCVLAPCGVRHGGFVPEDETASLLVGGLAAPPQLDLLINSGYYEKGQFTRPPFTPLALPGG